MFSPNPWEMAMATFNQRSILKIRKPGEVLISYKNCTFLYKYLNYRYIS